MAGHGYAGLPGSHRLGGPSTADGAKDLSQMVRRQGKSQDATRKVKLYQGVVEQCWARTPGCAVICHSYSLVHQKKHCILVECGWIMLSHYPLHVPGTMATSNFWQRLLNCNPDAQVFDQWLTAGIQRLRRGVPEARADPWYLALAVMHGMFCWQMIQLMAGNVSPWVHCSAVSPTNSTWLCVILYGMAAGCRIYWHYWCLMRSRRNSVTSKA